MEFAEAEWGERRAAHYLHVFTRLQPIWRDRGGRQGAADIELRARDGSAEVVEVTSTQEENHERERLQTDRLADEVQRGYTGQSAWFMHFSQGWRASWNRRVLQSRATLIARELEALDAQGLDHAVLLAVPSVHVRRSADGDAGVNVAGWSVNIPDPGLEPYLERLSRYLQTSRLIERKREKLLRESQVLGTERRHLYLLMAGTGTDGALLPMSPASMTWGQFGCPPEITDLWLDGGTGEIYRWNVISGWSFHRIWSKWDGTV